MLGSHSYKFVDEEKIDVGGVETGGTFGLVYIMSTNIWGSETCPGLTTTAELINT